MESNPSAKDPKTIWQTQPGEVSKVTLMLIRQKARDLRARTRRELFRTAWALLPFAIFSIVGILKGRSVIGLSPGPDSSQRIAFGGALLWCIAGAWVLQRGMWDAPLPGDAGLETGIAFLRREIQRQWELFGRWLLWALCPVLFTLGVAVGPLVWFLATTNPKLLRNAIPFFLILTVWTVAMVVIRIRRRRELQREFDELDAIEKENR
jgi:hypothetical protein